MLNLSPQVSPRKTPKLCTTHNTQQAESEKEENMRCTSRNVSWE